MKKKTYMPPALPEDMDELREFALKTHAQLYEQRETNRNPGVKLENQKAKLDEREVYLKWRQSELDRRWTALNEFQEEEVKKRIRLEDEIKIRRDWRAHASSAYHGMRMFLSSLPSPVDLRSFEQEDWDHIHELKQMHLRVIDELDNLRMASESRIVDVTSRMPAVIDENGA